MPTLANPPVVVDLENVSTLIGEAMHDIRSLDGMRVPEGNSPGRGDVRRDLLYIADLLTRAAAETRVQYHRLNGKEDSLA